MDPIKTGQLIRRMRKEYSMTQQELASLLHISDKTVSKWERGLGCPDLSLIPELAKTFVIDPSSLLKGELLLNPSIAGNMKKTIFYICPNCGNIFTALTASEISCCGKKIRPLQAEKAPEQARLSVEQIENDYYLTSEHPMTRDHFISFVALLTGDTVLFRKLYPEWDFQVRLPRIAHGRLLWYCSRHGLFWQEV